LIFPAFSVTWPALVVKQQFRAFFGNTNFYRFEAFVGLVNVISVRQMSVKK